MSDAKIITDNQASSAEIIKKAKDLFNQKQIEYNSTIPVAPKDVTQQEFQPSDTPAKTVQPPIKGQNSR